MRTTGFKKEVKEDNGIDNELITIRGIVIPVEWGEEGNALAVSISGAGEEEHFVEQDDEGKKLLELMQQEVEVSGTVREATQGHRVITVRSHGLKTGVD